MPDFRPLLGHHIARMPLKCHWILTIWALLFQQKKEPELGCTFKIVHCTYKGCAATYPKPCSRAMAPLQLTKSLACKAPDYPQLQKALGVYCWQVPDKNHPCRQNYAHAEWEYYWGLRQSPEPPLCPGKGVDLSGLRVRCPQHAAAKEPQPDIALASNDRLSTESMAGRFEGSRDSPEIAQLDPRLYLLAGFRRRPGRSRRILPKSVPSSVEHRQEATDKSLGQTG
jgi:hypothetical protein